MDPNATLKDMRSLSEAILVEHDKDFPDADKLAALATELAESMRDLDRWINRGGFLPSDWKGKLK